MAAFFDGQIDVITELWEDNLVELLKPHFADGSILHRGTNTPASEQAFWVDRATAEAHGLKSVEDMKKPGVWELFKEGIGSRQIERLWVVGSNDTTAPIIENSYKRFLKIMETHFSNLPFCERAVLSSKNNCSYMVVMCRRVVVITPHTRLKSTLTPSLDPTTSPTCLDPPPFGEVFLDFFVLNPNRPLVYRSQSLLPGSLWWKRVV